MISMQPIIHDALKHRLGSDIEVYAIVFLTGDTMAFLLIWQC